MAFSRMAFDPADGLKDINYYPTTPESEMQARAQVQRVSDQLRDFINDKLIAELESVQKGESGAEKLGSALIQNVAGETVYQQIADLKRQMDDISAGSLADGIVTEGKIANGAVSESKLAAGAVTESKIGAGAVTESKISDGAVTEAKIGDGAVSKSKLAADTLEWELVVDSGVLQSSGNVQMPSQVGKSEMMIQLRSADGMTVYATAIAPLNTDGRTMPLMHVMSTYDPADHKIDYRMVTVGSTAINYSVSRAEVVNGTTLMKRMFVFTR